MRIVPRSTLAVLGAGALLAGALGTVPAQAAGGDSFDNPDTGMTSTYTSVSGGYTWDEANAAAMGTSAPEGCTNHLAVITSQAEQDFINAHLGDQGDQYIGGQRDDNGDFQWVTGEPFDYTNWSAGEPNNYQDAENKIQFTGSANAWNDIAGSYTTGYIVETECKTQTPPPPAPTPQRAVVTSVDPSTGPASGGTTVTITGEHFTGAKSVKFGPFKATTYTVDSDTQITVTSPKAKLNAGSKPRKVDVRVLTVKKPSAVSPADKFTYTASPAVQ